MSHEPRIVDQEWREATAKNQRPFADIPEVGYALGRSSWSLMHLSEIDDGFAQFIGNVGELSWTRQGQPDRHVDPTCVLSEHTASDLLAAGIRIGIARERARVGHDPSGPVHAELLDRLRAIGTMVALECLGRSWRASVRLSKPDGSTSGGRLDYWGPTQELAVEEAESAADKWREHWAAG